MDSNVGGVEPGRVDALDDLTAEELQRFLEAKAELMAAGGVQQSLSAVLFAAATA